MTGQCTHCGTELLAGQQFCRRCGTRALAPEGDAPTRILADAPPPLHAQSTTALPPRGTGEPALPARPTEHQTPFGGGAYTAPLYVSTSLTDARRGSRVTPALVGILLVLGLGGALAVGLYSAGMFGGKVASVSDGGRADASRGVAAPALRSDETALDESGAAVSERETVLTQTFEIGPNTDFSFKSTDGSITVEGWDKNSVEVKVTKRGGTAEQRRDARVVLRRDDETFSFAAPDSTVKVFFEVKLPRGAREVALSSGDGEVSASKLEGPLTVSVRNGSVSLEDVRGPVQAKSVNGNIDVAYRSPRREGAHEFATVNGSIILRLAEGMSADVKGSVVNGRIEIDERFGIQPQKRQVGWNLDAPLGGGGQPLSVKSVNGSIRIRK